jgi:hypothetical protein
MWTTPDERSRAARRVPLACNRRCHCAFGGAPPRREREGRYQHHGSRNSDNNNNNQRFPLHIFLLKEIAAMLSLALCFVHVALEILCGPYFMPLPMTLI